MKKYNLDGKGIGVAVLDTGAFSHIDFDHRIVYFKDFVNGKKYMYDDNGHGTHVLGIIGGSGKASQGQHCGIAKGCHMIVLKVLDRRGNGKLEHLIRALHWIMEHKEEYGIRIVNISVGSVRSDSEHSITLEKEVEKVWDAGLIVVTAAGNLGPAPGSITSPGSSKKVITVGSSDLLDQETGISGVGPTKECVCKPDVVMPGVNVISCSHRGRYAIKSGTSMSTPKVSGAIALALEKDPRLTNIEIKMLLKESCTDLGYGRNRQGWGLLDIEKFLTAI